jgi:hypothetical protein
MTPVHDILPCSLKISFNIVLPSTPISSEWSLPFRFSNRIVLFVSCLSCTCYMPHQSHLPPFDRANNSWSRVETLKLLVMQLFPPSSCFLQWAWPKVEASVIACSKSHVRFPLLGSFQRCRNPRPCVTFRNMLYFYGDESLAPSIYAQARGLSLVSCPRYCVFSAF